MEIPSLLGPRLLLRPHCDEDFESFVALNADPEVMRHYPAPLSRQESQATFDRLRAHFATHGFGLWAVTRIGQDEPLGFVGIMRPSFTAHFTRPEQPCIELVWRLRRSAWGQGYASEGARLSAAYAFDVLGADEVVAMTVPANTRSWAVMERLGMQRNPDDDFDHPRIAEGHPLRRHVLYRLSATRWRELAGGHAPAPSAATASTPDRHRR